MVLRVLKSFFLNVQNLVSHSQRLIKFDSQIFYYCMEPNINAIFKVSSMYSDIQEPCL